VTERLCTNLCVGLSSLSLDQFYQLGLPNGKITQQCFCLWWQNKHCLVNFRHAKRLCVFCLMRQNKIHGFTWADQDWIGLMSFKNFAEQGWIGFNFCGSRLDSDWKISQSTHLWWVTQRCCCIFPRVGHGSGVPELTPAALWGFLSDPDPEWKVFEKPDLDTQVLFNCGSNRSLHGRDWTASTFAARPAWS